MKDVMTEDIESVKAALTWKLINYFQKSCPHVAGDDQSFKDREQVHNVHITWVETQQL